MWDGLCEPQTCAAHSSVLTYFNQSLSVAELNNQPAHGVVGAEQSQTGPGILKGPCLAAGWQRVPWLSDAVAVSMADTDIKIPAPLHEHCCDAGKWRGPPGITALHEPSWGCPVQSLLHFSSNDISSLLNEISSFAVKLLFFFLSARGQTVCLIVKQTKNAAFFLFYFNSFNKHCIVLIWLLKCIHLITKA